MYYMKYFEYRLDFTYFAKESFTISWNLSLNRSRYCNQHIVKNSLLVWRVHLFKQN